MPLMVAGSCPVYDCGTSPQGEFMPPGQKVHLPCGQLAGEVMMATGETPEIVLTGLLRSLCLINGRSCSLVWIKISMLVGMVLSLCFAANSRLCLVH